MQLTPKDRERLTVFQVAELARRRKERGVRLNYPETVGYIADWAFERARDGESVADIQAEATTLLTRADVMEGVPEMVDRVQVEPTFPDGTKLVTIHDPIRRDVPVNDGDDATDGDGDAGGDGASGGDGGAGA